MDVHTQLWGRWNIFALNLSIIFVSILRQTTVKNKEKIFSPFRWLWGLWTVIGHCPYSKCEEEQKQAQKQEKGQKDKRTKGQEGRTRSRARDEKSGFNIGCLVAEICKTWVDLFCMSNRHISESPSSYYQHWWIARASHLLLLLVHCMILTRSTLGQFLKVAWYYWTSYKNFIHWGDDSPQKKKVQWHQNHLTQYSAHHTKIFGIVKMACIKMIAHILLQQSWKQHYRQPLLALKMDHMSDIQYSIVIGRYSNMYPILTTYVSVRGCKIW